MQLLLMGKRSDRGLLFDKSKKCVLELFYWLKKIKNFLSKTILNINQKQLLREKYLQGKVDLI